MKKKTLHDFGDTELGIAYRFEVANCVKGADGYWYPTRDLPPTGINVPLKLEYRPALFRLRIVKKTPKGYWVADTWRDQVRWCGNENRKRYAYTTIAEARIDYDCRTECHIQRLEATLAHARHNLALHRDASLEAVKPIKFSGREY